MKDFCSQGKAICSTEGVSCGRKQLMHLQVAVCIDDNKRESISFYPPDLIIGILSAQTKC